ncbi:MAG: twin-arginine translocase TatA/TatE family subunit [Magnetococcales bacterium]|nr:twin-arginine translocase TatA/TatE family subunit [Magnetococcales bacterium]
MLGMGWIEILVVVVVALLVIGPESLPEVARSLAKGLRQVQRVVAEVRDSINLEEFERRHPPRPSVPPDEPSLPRVTGETSARPLSGGTIPTADARSESTKNDTATTP